MDRDFFPKILNEKKLFGCGAEIGTWKGEHAAMILKIWERGTLLCVDPWKTGAEYNEKKECIDSLGPLADSRSSMERYLKIAQKNLQPFVSIGRCVIIRKTSTEAAKEIEDGSMDWVYIDAQHHRKGVEKDIRMWTPKVKFGGIIGGHDYFDNPPKFCVKGVVDEYYGNRVQLVPTKPVPSWYVMMNDNPLT